MDWSSLKFASPLGAGGWAVLLGIPVSIVALYFLKLRRRPLQVPSTLLWQRSLEDLHVNSLFQRLRKNILLLLQLLMVLFLMLALLGIQFSGSGSLGQRVILVIDNSASMGAIDDPGQPSRFEQAKTSAVKIVNDMNRDDMVMVISFNNEARVVSNYTSNHKELIRRINDISLSERTTSLVEALQVASGLANPNKVGFEVKEGEEVTEIIPPEVILLSDGGFEDVKEFSLGNLKPRLLLIGPSGNSIEPPKPDPATNSPDAAPPKNAPLSAPSRNVSILALQTRRADNQTEKYQVFGRVKNHESAEVKTTAQLWEHSYDNPNDAGVMIDVVELNLPPGEEQSFQFDRDLKNEGAILEVRITHDDALALDNRAFTFIGNARKAQVLVVTPGNRFLRDTLNTELAVQLADVTFLTPEAAGEAANARDIQVGRYDFIIFDRYRPKEHPEANTLYMGSFPPGKEFDSPKEITYPSVIDWDSAHPLMQFVRDLRIVAIARAYVVEPPPGAKILIESDQGPIGFNVLRRGYTDTILTFGLYDGQKINTNWPLRISFPLFLFNALQFLGNASEVAAAGANLPGQPVLIRSGPLVESIKILCPDGTTVPAERNPQGMFVCTNTQKTGHYLATWEGGRSVFAVNLFNPRESDLATRGVPPAGVTPEIAEQYQIKIGNSPVDAANQFVPQSQSWWKPFAVIALILLLVEWYVYNRRVHL